jgi:hypothetical protein
VVSKSVKPAGGSTIDLSAIDDLLAELNLKK